MLFATLLRYEKGTLNTGKSRANGNTSLSLRSNSSTGTTSYQPIHMSTDAPRRHWAGPMSRGCRLYNPAERGTRCWQPCEYH